MSQSKVIEGRADGSGKQFYIVAARWNELVVSRLLEGAQATFRRQGVAPQDVTVVKVPGSYEIPLAVQEIIRYRKPAGVVTLGCLLKGETDHYDLISTNVSSTLMRLGCETGIPIGFGVICADTMDQALARCGGKVGNYGSEAAAAVVEMSELQGRIAHDTFDDARGEGAPAASNAMRIK